jgi:hypothetical protein
LALGFKHAVEHDWLSKHESDTYVKLMPPGRFAGWH